MAKYRIKNDIAIRWIINLNGETISLKGRELVVTIVSPIGQMITVPHTIIEPNTIATTFKAADQRVLGEYRLMLEDNTGGVRHTLDICHAFELVPCDCVADDVSGTAEVMHLQSVLITGIKGDKGDKGEPGADGANGIDGKDGKDGINGLDGRDGVDGKDGRDGIDGGIIYPKFTVDEHNMHLYVKDGANRMRVDDNGHLRIRTN